MLSEVDLRDWEQLDDTKLYNVENKTYIKAYDEYYFFDHVDGLYSLCKDMQDNIVHLSVFTPVTPLRKP